MDFAIRTYGKSFWQRTVGLNGDEAVGWALTRWMEPYANWKQFLGFIGLKYFNSKSKTGCHCSEFVSKSLEFCGVIFDKDTTLITPGDLHNLHCLTDPMEIYYENIH